MKILNWIIFTMSMFILLTLVYDAGKTKGEKNIVKLTNNMRPYEIVEKMEDMYYEHATQRKVLVFKNKKFYVLMAEEIKE